MGLTTDDRTRYARQMLIKGWGEETQQRLANSTVFILGAGGLGSPAALYLAAAGVGRIVIADLDRIELSNLNRQILHTTAGLGTPKAASAATALSALNPGVRVVALAEEVTDANIDKLSDGAGVLLDCLDNFPTRYVLNRCAIRTKRPLIHAAVTGFEGRLTVIDPGVTPCLRCLFPEGPQPGVFPVVGTTPGVIGVLQAAEALKLLTGLGEPLRGQLLVYDGAAASFHQVTLAFDPACPDCGLPIATNPLQ
ncbi:MAG: HesA/MoeB/ThiF family protein [Candidatus Coatesbacteria bacterium]